RTGDVPSWLALVEAHQADRQDGELPSRTRGLLRVRTNARAHGRWFGGRVRSRRRSHHPPRARCMGGGRRAGRRRRLDRLLGLRQALTSVIAVDVWVDTGGGGQR